jgi:hypothetical protein
MSRSRELQTGDLVEFRRPGDPWGVHVVLGAKSWKTLWVRHVLEPVASRRAAPRRRLLLVMPVEERLADILMREEG